MFETIEFKKIKLKDEYVLGSFGALRLLSVLLVQTSYVPDEYWQSLEVAHKLTFGYGYLTWEWVAGIRSYLHPLIIAAVYKLAWLLGLDTTAVLVYVPRVLQALLSAYADFCFYKWTFDRKWAAFSIATSWFWFYTASRTILNTLEAALTTIALSKYPWIGRGNCNDSRVFISLVALMCVIRPTAAVQWLPMCVFHLVSSKESSSSLIMKRYLPIGILAFVSSILVDSWAHGSLLVSSYEFMKANIFEGVGAHYGSQPWHWYLSQGFPAILGIQFIPFLVASVFILKNRRSFPNELALLGCVVFTIFVYSCLSHKEFRFILPLLPICLHISAGYLSRWSCKAKEYEHIDIYIWAVSIAILLGNLTPAWYFSMVHQRGTLDVMIPLREISLQNPKNANFLFLMPCHSTPLYSHLHANITTRFLTCEPNLNRTEHYVDEADQFYRSPNSWLRNNFAQNGTLPTHIILFDSLVPFVTEILSRYKLVTRLFHTSAPDSRVGPNVHVYQRIDV